MDANEAIARLRGAFAPRPVSVWLAEDDALHVGGPDAGHISEFGGHKVVYEGHPATVPQATVIAAPQSAPPAPAALARPAAPLREPLVLTDKPLPTTTLQGLGQYDRTLAKEVQKVNTMSKLAALADRIKTTKERREKWADGINARLDAGDSKEPDVFGRTEDYVKSALEAELTRMDDDLRQLSNSVPLE